MSVLVPAPQIPPADLIINGNMDVDQRLEGGVRTSTTTFDRDTSFACDRIFVLPAGASVTQNRSTTQLPANNRSQNANKIIGAASVTTVNCGQRISAEDVLTNGRQPLVFGAMIYNNTGASFTPSLLVDTPSALDNWAASTNRLTQVLQACPDAAYTQVWATFDPSAYTNIANGMSAYLQFPSGLLVAGKIVYVAQMRLNPGGVLLPYQPKKPSQHLADCQPYLEKSYDVGTALAAATATGSWFVLTSDNITTKLATVTVPFRAIKARAPTISYWDHAGAGGTGAAGRIATMVAAGTETQNVTPNVGVAGVSRANFRLLHSSTIAGMGFQWAANSELV